MKDKLGIFFSGLCLCHCIVMPLAIMFLSTSAVLSALHSEWFHQVLLLPVIIFALFSLPQTWLQTKNNWLLTMLITGLGLIFCAQLTKGWTETLLTLFGSLSLIISHIVSITWYRRSTA